VWTQQVRGCKEKQKRKQKEKRQGVDIKQNREDCACTTVKLLEKGGERKKENLQRGGVTRTVLSKKGGNEGQKWACIELGRQKG